MCLAPQISIMQCTELYRHASCLPLPGFSTLSHKRHDLRRKTLLKIKCVSWFSSQVLSETFLILRRTQRDIIINVHTSSCKVTLSLVRFYWNLNLLDRFSQNPQTSNFMKISPVRAELFQAEGQTDMTKLVVAFRSFAKGPKTTQEWVNVCMYICIYCPESFRTFKIARHCIDLAGRGKCYSLVMSLANWVAKTALPYLA